MNEIKDIFLFFDVIGSIAFMISGAISAAAADMDIGGMILLSMVTGVGGGTIRGLLLNQPIFWMQKNWYIYLAIIVAVFAFYTYRFLSDKKIEIMISIFDTCGLAPFMATGVSAALIAHQTNLVAIGIGVITCIGGGVIRDILCNKVPIIFQKDIYVTPVLIGSFCYIIVNHFFSTNLAMIISTIILLVLRFIVMAFSLNAPKPIKN